MTTEKKTCCYEYRNCVPRKAPSPDWKMTDPRPIPIYDTAIDVSYSASLVPYPRVPSNDNDNDKNFRLVHRRRTILPFCGRRDHHHHRRKALPSSQPVLSIAASIIRRRREARLLYRRGWTTWCGPPASVLQCVFSSRDVYGRERFPEVLKRVI